MTLVDTNVLLDVFTNDVNWASWSIAHLSSAASRGSLAINEIIFAELSVRFVSIEAVENALERAGIDVVAIPRAALFLAGKAFQRYRSSGGSRSSILPDFFIGAHAAVTGLSLLTRDAGRYHTYFPDVALIAP